MTINAAASTTLAELAEARLRRDIVAGTLAPKQKLRVEILKDQYEISGSPLREALARLACEGLVCFEGNKGFRVAPLSPDDLADIAYMRTAVESFALRTAIANGDADWEASIIASLHKLVRATETTETDPESLETWNVAHDRFHEALVGACKSPRVFEMQRRLADQHNRYRRFLMGCRIPREIIISGHRDLADAALERDIERASRLLAEHMQLTSGFYARILSDARESPSELERRRRRMSKARK